MAPSLWPIFWEIEDRLVQKLLRSPSFHRYVERIHKNVQRVRHGLPPEEMGGTKLDDPNKKPIKHFFELLWEELKTGHKFDPKNKR